MYFLFSRVPSLPSFLRSFLPPYSPPPHIHIHLVHIPPSKMPHFSEHLDYEVIQSTNPAFNRAVVRINIFKDHRQTIQYIQPHDRYVGDRDDGSINNASEGRGPEWSSVFCFCFFVGFTFKLYFSFFVIVFFFFFYELLFVFVFCLRWSRFSLSRNSVLQQRQKASLSAG